MRADPELQRDRAIASELARTWPAFFESFGRLTDVQRAAIPELLAGHDVLICAASAAGKTEAACAPLVERFVNLNRPWTILYISPTRALVNDLYRRLEGPLGRLGLGLQRRTGEHRCDLKRSVHVLLTTPESFDSILCRGRLPGPRGHALARVVAVVLDEIHLLVGTPRGEQVRWLLERLRRLRGQAKRQGWAPDDGFQLVALSATVADPEAVLAVYMPEGRVAKVGGNRSIEMVAPTGEDGQVDPYVPEKALPAYLAANGGGGAARLPSSTGQAGGAAKILVFCNSRRRADDLGIKLRPLLARLGYRLCVHHGSLARGVRLEAEEAARSVPKVVVVATSTLELRLEAALRLFLPEG